ncbi:MAG: M3 family metallopeptidase, partial [Burkholderiales bacterium]
AAIQEETAKLQTKFSENSLDATNAFMLTIDDKAELDGVPEDILEGFQAAAERDGKTGYKLTLQMPSYLPVMQYCSNRALREKMYHASATRASEFGKPELDNTDIILRLLELRREVAKLLGYKSFAELSLVPKMAQTPADVLGFLDDLTVKAKPFAERDMMELREYAKRELALTDPQSWDFTFASERLRQERYAFSDHEVKQYFPEPKVLEGMFRVVQSIYGLRITETTAETWHPDVRFFSIKDADGSEVGQFYLDLYARDTKRGGAWMDEAISRRRVRGRVQAPVAYLVCNFPSPVGGKPALFTHDDVITLFHEFGHGLHHLLTRVDYLQVSGIRGVEWDAVELPSQFMENFCWEWEVLRHMTAHVDSGTPLPRPLYDKMVAAKNFQSGMQTVRQLEYSLFDMQLHHDFDPALARAGKKTPLQLLDEIRARVAVVVPPAYSRFPNTFGHIFAGGYSAGYYSYKWAEVLSADAYAMFEEDGAKGSRVGVLDPATGKRFRDEVLAMGGSRPAIESFRAFRGREPKVDALLRHNGMVVA